MQSKDLYYQKYLKYKNKYLNLQSQIGGANNASEINKLKKINLTTQNLQQNNIGDEGIKELTEALKTNTTLTTLNLQQKNIGDEDIKALAEALKTNTTLTTLNLQQNNIGDEGIEALAEALKTNKTLKTLNLQQNNIGDEGVKKLAFILFNEFNITLKNIDLKFNDKITSNGVFTELKSTIDKSDLYTIELNNNIGFTRIYDILLYNYIQINKQKLNKKKQIYLK